MCPLSKWKADLATKDDLIIFSEMILLFIYIDSLPVALVPNFMAVKCSSVFVFLHTLCSLHLKNLKNALNSVQC